MVTFVFAVQAMAHNPHKDERRSNQGNWLPSKELGYNVKRAIEVPGEGNVPLLLFHYDSSRDPPTQRIFHLPAGSREYKTYSLYHDRSRFLLVNFDATKYRVGDGVESGARTPPRRVRTVDTSSSDEDDDNPAYDNWVELSFKRLEDDAQNDWYSVSRAGPRQEHRRLTVRHPRQQCIQHFLPDRYHAQQTTQDERHGGLVGDLALLIAIVAMSQPSYKWSTLLPEAIQNPWRVPRWQLQNIDRGSEWFDKRGVMTTVVLLPGGSLAEDLAEIEQGAWGALLR